MVTMVSGLPSGKDRAGQDGGSIEQGRCLRLQADTRTGGHPDAGQFDTLTQNSLTKSLIK
jgi:hypothetical protein